MSEFACCQRRCSVAVTFSRLSRVGFLKTCCWQCCCCREVLLTLPSCGVQLSPLWRTCVCPYLSADLWVQCFPGSKWKSVCTHTADLLTLSFKAAPPPLRTSHFNANGSHRPVLTLKTDRITTVIGIPCCPRQQRSSIPNSANCGKDHRASLPKITRYEGLSRTVDVCTTENQPKCSYQSYLL